MSREDTLRRAWQASQRLENGYRKYHIQKAIKEGNSGAMAEHARYLDNGYDRYTIEQAAKNLKAPGK
jgi:hypothetical protein